jgi:endonuclease/exonuclease/phosphatase family metal-dependent hydrolase
MLRVATYNIHRAVGADGRLQPERTARVVLSLDADLVALQEVEMPALPSTRLLLSRFAEAGYRSLLGLFLARDLGPLNCPDKGRYPETQ